MADTPIETRLARLETLPDSLERIERGLDRVSERLDNLHRLEQQQAHHSQIAPLRARGRRHPT